MKAGKYSVKELLVNRYLEQIIIPEIQRDYVWGNEQVTGLLISIAKDFERYTDGSKELVSISSSDPLIIESFKEFYNKTKNASNIGFVYAYNEPEYPGKYFLIDGQQRLTTIYLLLTTLAARSTGRIMLDFERYYYPNQRLKIDYKVRESAHDFLGSFVPYILEGGNDVRNQQWYFEFYKNDATIEHLITNQTTINNFLDEVNLDEEAFYHYVSDLTEFWYFDTNVSKQGEELYIYMNARGEQIQSNENIKAALLSKLGNIDQKNHWGRIWEDWQDFFWKRKEDNENADKGFNEFLVCIAGLEQYLTGSKKYFYSNEKYQDKKGIATDDIVSILSVETIDKYFQGLQNLELCKAEIINTYRYSKWINDYYEQFWKLFNKDQTNWFAKYDDENRGAERNRMVFVWSTLHYIATADIENHLSTARTLRIFYLRYHNYNRSASSIKANILSLINEGKPLVDGDSKEEALKANFWSQFNDAELIQVEEVIWKLEDHPHNLNGRDVGATNISHLLDLTTKTELKELKKLCDKFYEVFESDNDKLKSLMLYYGDYWYRVSPYYYNNLGFAFWRWIIRGLDYEEGSSGITSFKNLITEVIERDVSVADLLDEKRSKPIFYNPNRSFREKLIWYNHYLQESMWKHGSYIALREWDGKDKAFPDSHPFTNTKGDFKGYSNTQLYTLLPKSAKDEVKIFKQSQSTPHAIPN